MSLPGAVHGTVTGSGTRSEPLGKKRKNIASSSGMRDNGIRTRLRV